MPDFEESTNQSTRFRRTKLDKEQAAREAVIAEKALETGLANAEHILETAKRLGATATAATIRPELALWRRVRPNGAFDKIFRNAYSYDIVGPTKSAWCILEAHSGNQNPTKDITSPANSGVALNLDGTLQIYNQDYETQKAYAGKVLARPEDFILFETLPGFSVNSGLSSDGKRIEVAIEAITCGMQRFVDENGLVL